MTAERAVAFGAAAVSAAWALYNVVVLASEGRFFMPGNRIGGVGHWESAASAPGMCALAMAIYALAPLFFSYLGLRRRPQA